MLWRIVEFLMFVAPGVYLLQRARRDVQLVKRSMSWPSVPGRVVHSSYREEVVKNEDTETEYVPLIQYEYQVGGEIHRGSRIAFFSEHYGSREKALERLGAFPAGHPVNVFYDPAKPGEAVLQRQDKGSGLVAAAGWVLLAVGIAALFNNHLFGE